MNTKNGTALFLIILVAVTIAGLIVAKIVGDEVSKQVSDSNPLKRFGF
jgi:hypothetical protein